MIINHKERILIINDEEDVRAMIRIFLEDKEYEVLEAADGHQGIEQAESCQPDLILLDIVMPVIDGYQTCQALKLNKATVDIPVIFLSSLSDAKDKIKGLEMGGVDFIPRTGDRGELIARVQTHLRLSALTRELKEKNLELLQKQKLIDEDLQIASAIQRSLLPSPQLVIPNFDIAWMCLPCTQIGGDIFNIFQISDINTAFYILDVSGHGVASALITVSISEYFHRLIQYSPENKSLEMQSPKQMLDCLNKAFPFERFEEFFSIFYMVIDPQSGKLIYANAGHPPAIILRANDGIDILETQDTVVGLVIKEAEEKTVSIKKDDRAILYTDGVTECMNDRGEFYGEARFLQLLESIKHRSSKEIVEAIRADLTGFANNTPFQDDISIMVVALS